MISFTDLNLQMKHYMDNEKTYLGIIKLKLSKRDHWCISNVSKKLEGP